ncbi:heme-binding domain-containing protein, partial [Niastella vici]|uniref:heme-binding domain-containing protein n=1 Tax=Niastella vici TaxID=1703345 RepID=UPI00156E7B4E
AELNFSEFGSYSLRRQISKLKSIENSINDGTMPLSSYTFIHKNAKLSQNDKALIIDWVQKTRDGLAMKN